MTALAQKEVLTQDALTDEEKDKLYSILDLFEITDDRILDNYCEDCDACTYESDTGYWDCPAGNNPYDSSCVRDELSENFATIEKEALKFLMNIRDCW
ncbi:MAG: hypothetical protein IJQ56_02325 [Synergistaceae bacterium]|nr:hypothetical protein [Synergistaceae bacterium]